MKHLLNILFFLISVVSFGQPTDFYTTFPSGSFTSGALVHLPSDYYSRTDSVQCIIFYTGSGEVGIDTSKIDNYGPHSYLRGGWDGGVQLANGKYYPIIISIQLPATFKQAPDLDILRQNILDSFRIHTVKLTGLSAGGWEAGMQVAYKASPGSTYYQDKVKGIAIFSAVEPSDMQGSTPVYPDRFTDYALAGGKAFVTVQSGDFIPNENAIVTTMNAAVAGSATYETTTNGAGTHCCWDYEYGSATRVPRTHIINGITQNIYQYLIRAGGDTSLGTPNGQFSFTLSTSQKTSAAVFKTDSTLVRTLWADSTMTAGTYTKYWDGKNDTGVTLTSPDPNYVIKVLTNNVGYAWEGVVGNTSAVNTGSGVHKGLYTSMTGMAITGSTAYYCQGYSEGYSSEAKFNTASPQIRLSVFGGKVSTMNSDYVVTDGTNVYWAGYDAFSTSNSFVHATAVSNDAQVSFGANGSTYNMTNVPYSKVYTSVIDKLNVTNSKPTGLAVGSTYLFVSHGGLNQLHVLNKTTGALVQNLTVTNPRGLSVEGSSLWMVSATNTVAKYTINAGGTLTAATLTLSGITTPGAIAANSGNIAVIDAGTNQIVRFYNTTTGVQGTQLGTTGGYSGSPDVTNTKYFFNDYRGNTNSFLAFAPDGSFWVGDPGNYRELHYTAAKTYMEYIMSMGASYSSCVDPNNINRVFGNYLEFAIDYTQALSGSTGWSLVKNWGYPSSIGNVQLSKLTNVVTLSNGRTYGFDSNGGFAELTSTGLRYTGLNPSGILCKDGSLQTATGKEDAGFTLTITKYPLTGFNGSNNPLWSASGTLLATTPTNSDLNPNTRPQTEALTSNDKVIFYTTTKQFLGQTSKPQSGYHLGSIKKGQNAWLWKTQRADHVAYQGLFPKSDYFERGNNVNDYAGSRVTISDRNIFAGHHGEFWKNVQTNYYAHFLDDGMPVAQFGSDQYIHPAIADTATAGNALTPMVVKNGTTLYLYHGDESQHAGIHRWKITNLSSIAEQQFLIPFPSAYVAPTFNYTDLHLGLPFNVALSTVAGWSTTGTFYSTATNRKKYVNDGSPDVYSEFRGSSGTASVNRDLGNNNVTTNWKIAGLVSFELSDVTASGIVSYVDVLDNAGKILARFYYNNPSGVATLHGNTVNIATGSALQAKLLQFQPLEISCVSGTITFNYAGYSPVSTTISDLTGDWQQPKTLRQYFTGGNPANWKNIGFMDMKLYLDYGAVAPNIPPVANAGADKAITLPTSTVTLDGSGTDADGTISSYAWNKVSGPSGGTIVSPNSDTTDINSITLAGTYVYRLTVTDNSGATATDNVTVVVAPLLTTRHYMGSGSGSIYFINNGLVKKKDTICVAAGTYDQISFDGLVGSIDSVIVIEPCGGVVTVTNNSLYCYRVVNSQFIHFTGVGAGTFYGFVATQPNPAIHCGSGMNFKEGTSDYEIDHYDSYNCENGFLCKIDPDDSTLASYSNGWTIANVKIHDNRVRKTQGEGIYFTNTAATEVVKGFSGADTTVEPVKALNPEFYNNILDSTGWDGIQVAASFNAKIHNNVVTNYGWKNAGSQQGGILLGGKSTGSIRDNYINGGTGNGIQLFGYLTDTIANNVVINAGIDGTANGQHGIFIDDRPDPSNQYNWLNAFVMNNTVVNSGNYSVGIFNSNGTMNTTSKIYNNIFVQTGSKYYDIQGGAEVNILNNIELATTGAALFAGGNDYHLLYNSPAVNAGLDLSYYNIPRDIDGVTRTPPYYDAGAYEFAGTPPTIPVIRAFFIIHGKVIFR